MSPKGVTKIVKYSKSDNTCICICVCINTWKIFGRMNKSKDNAAYLWGQDAEEGCRGTGVSLLIHCFLYGLKILYNDQLLFSEGKKVISSNRIKTKTTIIKRISNKPGWELNSNIFKQISALRYFQHLRLNKSLFGDCCTTETEDTCSKCCLVEVLCSRQVVSYPEYSFSLNQLSPLDLLFTLCTTSI